MQRLLNFALLLCLTAISMPLFGQEEVQPKELITENALLWEISGKDVKKTSYLYGTIHMIGRDDFFMTDQTKAAFAECKRVTFEIDMAEMTNLFSQISLMMQIFMDDGLRLSDLLSEDDYKLVSDHFEAQGMPMFMLDRIKPLFVSAMADTDMGSLDPTGSSESEMVSYEFEFYDMAKAMELETAGLETAEYQVSLFDSIPYEVQAEMLLESVKMSVEADGTEAEGESEMDMLTRLYTTEDINAMASSFSEEDSQYAPYEKLLLINRNINWIPVMAEMMAEKPTFFAVGAGHLGGEQGVVNLLREAGYTVKPITNQNP
ncbi:MAG: TraB/GumN family protein [Bacteroidetes bacterium]|nr:TraB/GumN family protein [Bacteroidota bacterium]